MNSEQKSKLMKAAIEALANPYPKDSKLIFSAAVLTNEVMFMLVLSILATLIL